MEKERYHKISEENTKKLKIIKKIIVRLKNMPHKIRYINKSALERYFLFVFLLIFKG